MKQVKVLRLMTGEEILGPVLYNEQQNKYTIETPVRMIFIQERKSLMFMPLCLFSEQKEYNINADHVTYDYVPTTEIINQYNTQFGTGLVLPEKQGFIIP